MGERLPLFVHTYGSRFEVGIRTSLGYIRLEDFWSPPGVTEQECEDYIAWMQKASDDYMEKIRPTRPVAAPMHITVRKRR